MGTIIITGANGSVAIPAVEQLLSQHPDHTLVLTVRNAASEDPNTQRLRDVISQHETAKASIRQLDLASLSSVHQFAGEIASEISEGKLPHLTSIICNAYYWNMVTEAQLTEDGYEKTFQVNHLAHAVLALRLLSHFGPDGGRIVLFSSDTHFPGQSPLEKYPPVIPDDLDLLAKPPNYENADPMGRGFQNYSVSKLAITMWMYAINRYLEKDEDLKNITVVAINPGNLTDSRALQVNTPTQVKIMSSFIIRPFSFLLRRFMDPTMRTTGEAAADVVGLAINTISPGETGYFTLSKKDKSSTDSYNEDVQDKLWKKTLEWGSITKENSPLKEA
ncbi:NAD(P)-binding protein [Aspergillus steynii IBT 23096]|uniref:3beta-hydroxysteroid 3-dehydrogenase n=1 Tax=Aspergillus steynii IBT 23096 TaxID=1392250 RepID=A0A2I2GS08_9EURO|nr:NAD(P)-binding protein [Aspergillus steynii IBT 23096]PLB55667.1 NAD(P)-binding protein [Aspergillus steynii IBT 23096]